MLPRYAGFSSAMRGRRRGASLAVLSALALTSAYATDNTTTPPDPGPSTCSSCPFTYGWSGSASLGLTNISGGNYPYGEYSGYYDKGPYLAADGTLAYRDKSGYFLDASGGNLGLDSRWIDITGGHQGQFELYSSFRQTPQYLFDTAQTPFLGAGGTNQTLPASWAYGGTTAQMTALAAAQQPIGIRNQRHTAAFGGEITPPTSNWDFAFNLRQDLQTGTEITGASFLATATQLATPVDYRTNQIDASAGYTRGKWQIRGGYFGSFFSDANTSVDWSNPFLPIAPGTNQGSMSLAPSNAFNQFSLTGAWQLFTTTRLAASLAYGRGTQDAGFIPTTINPTLAAAPLTVSSLSGLVDTGNYIVRLTSSPLRNLSLVGEYLIDRRDNQTARNIYQQVSTDTFLAANQINLPYSYDREVAKFTAAYRIVPQLKLQLGAAEQHDDHTFAAELATRTTSTWVEISSSFASSFDFSAKYSHSQRDLGSYRLIDAVPAADNPLLQQFDVANRTRDQWRATASYTPVSNLGLDFVVQQNDDKYANSPIGLTADKDFSATIDVSLKPTDASSIDTFVTHETIRSDQAGSQSFSVPDWYGSNRVTVDTIGLSGKWRDVFPSVDVGADISYSYSRELVAVDTGTAETPFPNNTVNYATLKLWSRYRVSPRCSVRFGYAYERLSTLDWSLYGIETDTVANVLALGVASPRYNVNVLDLRFQYVF